MSGNKTLDEIVTLIEGADKAFDLAAPFVGLDAFAPLVDSLTKLLVKVQQMAEDAGKSAAAEIQAADVAADASEDAKFPVGTP
jgi:hypothetical protein